jgi:hypothetical protein
VESGWDVGGRGGVGESSVVGVEVEESHLIAGQLMHAGTRSVTVTVGFVGTDLGAAAHRNANAEPTILAQIKFVEEIETTKPKQIGKLDVLGFSARLRLKSPRKMLTPRPKDTK